MLIFIQQGTLERVRQDRLALQQQVAEFKAHAEKLAEDNEALSKRIAAQEAKGGQTTTPEASNELLQLRGEVSRQHLAEREAEQRRLAEAQAKLPQARVELERVRMLRAEKVVSEQEFLKAQLGVDVLEAAAKGDQAQEAQVRLRYAETELARASELRRQSLISQAEYDEAAKKVEALKGGSR
jgi:hypothetical protein